MADCIYFDGRKGATPVQHAGENGKLHKSIILEEHNVIVGQAGKFYLTHIPPNDGTAK